MRAVGRDVFLCSCGGTMPLDGRKIAEAAQAAGLADDEADAFIHKDLCRTEFPVLQEALSNGARCLVGCTQEKARFEGLLRGKGADGKTDYVNLRETAGWADEAVAATPKIVALLAAAAVEADPTPILHIEVGNRLLVYGSGAQTLDAAQRLSECCAVVLVLTPGSDILLPSERAFPIYVGTTTSCRGRLGQFTVAFRELGEVLPWARGAGETAAKAPGEIVADLVLDLSAAGALSSAEHRPLGYCWADPRDGRAFERAIGYIAAITATGHIEKPRFVSHDEVKCVHALGGKVTCQRCVDNCPTGAIAPVDGKITIDAVRCAGCGSCAIVCPTGAVTYDAPTDDVTRRRLMVMLEAFREAGGEHPVVLIHTGKIGMESIAALSHRGTGLPANVLPLALPKTTHVGVDLSALALALGARKIVVQLDPETRREAASLTDQVAQTAAILTALGYPRDSVEVVDDVDPDMLQRAITVVPSTSMGSLGRSALSLPVGSRRSVARQCLSALLVDAVPVNLDKGAPLGRVAISAACTLCRACTRSCPTEAIVGSVNPPMLGFVEERCVQCGVCAAICPENAITLEPRLSPAKAAAAFVVLKEDEPATCPSCGVKFGSRMTIESVVKRLQSSGWSDQNAALVERLRYCENCRVVS